MLTDTASLGTILGVWAHPDDEAFLSAALMATATDAGQRVVVVTATAGELGGDAAVRRAELRRALAGVGVAEYIVLGYGDGRCAAVRAPEAAGGLERIIAEVEPDTIVTFGPDGFTGHADHRAVSRWVDLAVRRRQRRPRVLHATKPFDFRVRYGALNDRFDVFEPGLPVPVAADDLALHVEPSGDVLRRKLAALRAHRSQTGSLMDAVGEPAFAAWWGSESFVAAPDLHDLTTSSPRTAALAASGCST